MINKNKNRKLKEEPNKETNEMQRAQMIGIQDKQQHTDDWY